jgi:membrane-associated protease RseP (regulator of RpoE activity)
VNDPEQSPSPPEDAQTVEPPPPVSSDASPASAGEVSGEERRERLEPRDGGAPMDSSESVDENDPLEPAEPLRWQTPAILFVASVTTALWAQREVVEQGYSLRALLSGWKFAVPLFAILLAHEFGHYIAARLHKVRASLPYFLPMPLSPFGTWGAIIGMPDRIATPRALLDIGAAGPLAGFVVAVPVLALGLSWSPVKPLDPHALLEGQCLLYWAMKRLIVGPIPAGHDVFLHPTAFAGWAGLFITMINLLPSAQLDGGHIAYALLGKRQNTLADWVYKLLPVLFLANWAVNLFHTRTSTGGREDDTTALANSFFWFLWFGILTLIRRFGGKDHPPTDDGLVLDGPRKGVAVLCLVLFVLLFMPSPFTVT